MRGNGQYQDTRAQNPLAGNPGNMRLISHNVKRIRDDYQNGIGEYFTMFSVTDLTIPAFT